MPVTTPATPKIKPEARLAPIDRDRLAQRLALAAILALALILRLAMASRPSMHHPDEVMQYLEAAHRLVFGYGLVPWEYAAGIRSWFFPLLLSLPMALGNELDPDGGLYLWLPKLAMVAASLSIVWSAWLLGRRVSPLHALFAGFVAAIWFELVYFAPHTLTETAATAAAFLATALLSRKEAADDVIDRRHLGAGALLATAFILRFQFAPALIVLAGFGCRLRLRRWTMLATGGAAILLISAAIDLWAGIVPFDWLVENIRQNLIENRAADYGSMPMLGYVAWLEHLWGWWLLPIALAVVPGARREPALFWAAVALFAFHSLIPHKEYRFILFSTASFVVLAALGTAEWVDSLSIWNPRLPRVAIAGGAFALWFIASASIAFRPGYRVMIERASDMLAAQRYLEHDRGLCGVALFRRPVVEWGGYTYLHRNVPVSYVQMLDPALHGAEPSEALRQWSKDYNRILTGPEQGSQLPSGYRVKRCFRMIGSSDPSLCVYARPGSCDTRSASPFRLDRVMARSDQDAKR